MGSFCSTVTSQQVTDDLEDVLKQSAKDLLAADFSFTISDENSPSLEDYVGAIATHGFTKAFSYDWSSSNCSPPTTTDGTKVKPATDFCIISKDQDLSQGINGYVDKGLADADLELWMKRNATADLANFFTQCADFPCDNEWHYTSHTAKFNSSHPDRDSYQLDLLLVYANATRTESAVAVTLHHFYFVGVYYPIASPATDGFVDLKSIAYSKAVDLLKGDNVTVTVDSNETLEPALFQDSCFKFHTKWSYAYSDASARPSDYPTNESDALFTKTTHLCYFSSKDRTNLDFLNSYVKLNIMGALNIPVASTSGTTVSDTIQGDIATNFYSILQQDDSGDWTPVYIDKDYELNKATANPIRVNIIVSYFTDSKTVSFTDTDGQQQSVSVRIEYLYFLGVVYELKPADVAQDLKRQLCINLGLDATTLPSNITPKYLTDEVESVNYDAFKTTYGFSFPTIVPFPAHVAYWKAFFEFDSLDPSEEDIEGKVKEQLLDPGNGTTDPGDGKLKNGSLDVYKFIIKNFKYYAGSKSTDFTKDNNQWYNGTNETNIEYTSKSKKEHNLDVRTSSEFTNGSITEDGQGGTTAARFYMSLLLHITESDVVLSDTSSEV